MVKWTPIVAISCLTIIEIVALLNGIDGVLFSLVIAAISGLGGYQIKALVNNVKGGRP
jgi:hypothetical protein